MVVPNHDLIQRILRRIATADQGKDVAAEKHLDSANSPAAPIEISAEDLAEGIAVIDSEAAVGAGGEAAVVLVEGDVEELDRARVWVGTEDGAVIVGGGGGIAVIGVGSGVVGGSSVVRRRVGLEALLLLLEVGLEHGGDQIGIRVRVWMGGDGGHGAGGDPDGITEKGRSGLNLGVETIDAMREIRRKGLK